jgi:cobalt-zinc-cadmium efflux system membrane fusion protein
MTHTSPMGPAPAPRPMPRGRQWTLLAIAAAVALALFFGLPALGRLFAPKPPPPPAAPPPGTFTATAEQWATFRFAQIQAKDFRPEIDTDGKIATDDNHTTQVFSPFSGRVTKVFVKAGDKVKAGQPLFAVHAAEYVQGQSDLQTASAQLKLAEANETRLHALVQTNGAALKDWQQSQSDLAVAQAAQRAATNRLKILGQSDEQIAALADQRTPGETVVASPIAGTVTQRAVGVGQNIGSVTNGGVSPAFVVSDLSTVWLVGNVREDDALRARPGEPVEVRVAAAPGRVFTATVDYVSPTVDPTTHRLAVRASLANTDGALRPEMFASFGVYTGVSTQAVLAPEEAVIFEGDTARVWVAHPANRALELRQIKAGMVGDGQVEVLSGLKAGEQVVTSGSLFIDRAATAN